MNNKFKLALRDIYSGISTWRTWLLLGWQDIRLRYRRSQLGPFWITISMAITTYSMGFLYGHLFKMDLQNYFPFLAAGLLVWALISTVINESTGAFIEAAGYLKQVKLSPIIFVLRIVTRNVIIFAHNILPIIPLIIYFHVPLGWHTLLFLPGLLIISINGLVFGTILSILGARFRDINQIIVSVVQVIFFLTPVMWPTRQLPDKYLFVVKFNPFAQFIEIVRAPLIGEHLTLYPYMVVGTITVIGIGFMLGLYSKIRHRIIYWL